ncbi:MAG: Na-K-Cl cotransporter, partial [Fulvivirga sp.]|nr:Na-K-Cl cotransporter [Fulvivirga sp.]
RTLVETYGMGPLVPNTIVLGHTLEAEHRKAYCEMISDFYKSTRNVLIVRDSDNSPDKIKKRIDVWWGGLNKNGGLMILLAHLLQNSADWRGATINIKMVLPSAQAAEDVSSNLKSILSDMRVEATYDIILKGEKPFHQLLTEKSHDADLVFLGMAEPHDNYENYYANLMEKTKDLPMTMFVLAAEETAFGDVLK